MEKTGVTRFEWLQAAVLVLLSPLFLFPKENLAWLFAVIPLLWVIRKMVKREFLERTVIDLPLLIILVMVFITTLSGANASHSLPKAAGLLLGVGLFYAITALLKTEKLLKAGIGFFLFGGFLFSIVGLLGMFTFKVKHLTLLMKLKELLPQINFQLPGAEEGFHPNAVGGTLILIIPLFMVLAFVYWRKKSRRLGFLLLILAGLGFTFGVLLLTQSRGAWLGLLVACIIVFFLFLLKRKIYLIGFLVLLLIFSFIVVPLLLEMDQVKLTTSQAEGTLFFRIQMWNVVMPMIHANPVVGIGLNQFRHHYEVKYKYSHPHNKLLLLAVELGIPGLIAYLALLGCVGYAVVRVWKESDNTWLSLAVLGLGCGQMAHFLFEMTDAVPFGAKVNIFSWLSLALIMAVYNYNFKPGAMEK
jgi:putative inorganic carbon (HCO3(-)) transporter